VLAAVVQQALRQLEAWVKLSHQTLALALELTLLAVQTVLWKKVPARGEAAARML
jgi:hypothetical protein